MNAEFKVVIWGLGINGKNLIDVIGGDNVIAVIESDKEKVKMETYQGISIIDFATYMNEYVQCYIVVTPMKYELIIKTLEDNNIYRYFLLNERNVSLALFREINAGRLTTNYRLSKRRKYYIEGIDFINIYLLYYLSRMGYHVQLFNIEPKWIPLIEDLWTNNIIPPSCVSAGECILEKDIISPDFLNERIYSEWRKDLQKFKNCHEGKRVFIVATGPSLKLEDIEKIYLNHEITISMNWICYMFSKTEWRPNYYVATDGNMIREYEKIPEVDNVFKGIEKIFSDNYLKFWDKSWDNSYHCFRKVQDSREIGFSDDFSKAAYSGYTVVYMCLQLAVYMGFRNIYLVGCDFNYCMNANSENNHFYDERENTKYGVIKFDYDFVGQAYRKAKEYTESLGINIYNATRGGKLEIFQRVEFDELFEKSTSEQD